VRKLTKRCVGLNKLMLMSPCIVIVVDGYFVWIWLMVVCRFLILLGWGCGRLYVLIIVCVGLSFLSLLYRWVMIVSMSGLWMSVSIV